MTSKKNHCRNWKLYVITEKKGDLSDLKSSVLKAIEGGASVVQLRDKMLSDHDLAGQAKGLLELTRPRHIPLIINDRIQVAKMCNADGVHLGQEDGSLVEARRILGQQAIIGRSTHSPEQALDGEREGFDYIGVGPVFPTPTKPDYPPVGLELVRFASKNISIPFVAIGGISAENIDRVLEAGARTVAVVRAVIGSPDPKIAAQNLRNRMDLI